MYYRLFQFHAKCNHQIQLKFVSVEFLNSYLKLAINKTKQIFNLKLFVSLSRFIASQNSQWE